MAQTIKLKRSGTQGAAPTTSNLALGEVAINTYDGKMYIKKDVGGTESIVEIGGSGSVSYLEAGMIEYEYTATSNQTTFSGSDSNSATLSYTANSVLVFLNGVLQDDGVDYTATNGTSVVFGSALTANDEVRIVAFTNVTTASSLQDPTKLDAISTVNNQAAYSLTLSSSAYTPSSQNALIVSLNGITQEPGDSFTISGSTITFSPALVTGDVVDYIVDMGRAVTIGEYSGDLAVGGELEVTGDIIGDLRGATLFNAQAGEALSKGDVVYISGISGNTTVVSKADANDAAKMPAFGIASAAANLNASVDIYTFGRLSGLDTSAFSEGDELFVSTTAGALTSTAPTGESSKLQKIAKVTRSHASTGSIFIMGAGRSNAVPNLDDGDIFIGNASNQAVSAALDTSIVPENGNLYFTTARVDSHLSGGTGVTYNAGEISIGQDVSTTATPTFGNITTTGYIAGPSTFTIDPAAVGDDTGTLVVAGNLQVDGTTTTINSTTMTVDDLNITLASGAANAAAANGAGITVDGASATLTYNGTNDDWNFNKDINVTGTATMDSLTVDGPVAINSNSFVQTTATPAYNLIESDVTDENTQLIQASGTFRIRTVDDAGSSAVERMRIDHGTGDISFYEDTGTTAKLFWDASTERLGIGTSAPDKTLVVSGVGAEIVINDTDTTDTPRLRFRESGSTSGSISTDGGEMRFDTSSTERMRIDSSGNVGIGTTSPDEKLVVNGNLAFSYNTSISAYTIGKASDAYGIEYYSGVTSDSTKIAHTFSSAVNSNILSITYGGTVGIGVTNPTGATLEIQSNAGANALKLRARTNDDYSFIQFYDNAGTTLRGQIANHNGAINLYTGSSGTIRTHIDTAGNVGVGTDSIAPVISSSKTLQVASTGNTTLSVRSTDGVNDRSAILELLSSGNGVSKSIILYGDTDTSPGTPSPLVIQKYHSGSRTEVGRFNTSGHFVLGASTTAFFRLKSGATGTDGGIQWMFNSDATVYGSLTLPYDTRATTGLHLYSGYPITYTVPSNKAHQFVTGSSEAARIDADGIKFNGDTAAANALDDYEEGTFTPSFAFSGGNGSGSWTFSNATGRYTKIGNVCYYAIDLRFNSFIKGTASGQPQLTNLPFTPANYGNYNRPQCDIVLYQYPYTTTDGYYYGGSPRQDGSTNRIDLSLNVPNAASTYLNDPDSNSMIFCSGFYYTT